MNATHLKTYLNDHLAGSTLAIELMQHIERQYSDAPISERVARVKTEVESDRGVLKDLIGRLKSSESVARKTAGWLGERLTRLKLRLDDPSEGALYLFEALEVLSLGIEGKRGLWQALASSSDAIPELRGLDYDALMKRATAQRSVLEPARLHLARSAFLGSGTAASDRQAP